MESYCVHCTEMAFDICEVLVVYYVEKLDIKSTFLTPSQRHIFCILPSNKHHMELLIVLGVKKRRNCRISAWEIESERPNFFKGLGVQQFAGSISAGCEKHSVVVREGDSEDFVSVDISGQFDALFLEVVFEESALVSAVVN